MIEKLSSKRIGEIGQKAFDMWVNQAGITANSSLIDERGWDFYLQLPSAEEDLKLGVWDKAPPEIGCMVQVKTTTSNEQSEEITLSNWQRMIREPQPWFVTAIRLDADNQPSKVYLIHIDQEWSKRVLLRLRELAKQGKKHPNEHTMNVTWTELDRLPVLHGREIIRKIRECVKPDLQTYIMEKMDTYANLGYTHKRKTVNVRFRVTDKETFFDKLADVGIGVRPVLPGDWNASILDERFEIKAAFQEFGMETGDMEFHPEPTPVSFEVFNDATGRRVTVNCDFYRSVFQFPFLPQEFDKSRLVYKHFECILGRIQPGKFGAQFSVDVDPVSSMTVQEMRTVSDFMLLLREHAKHPIGLGIDGKKVDNLLLPNQEIMGHSEFEKFELIHSSVQMCETFGVSDNEKVTFEGLFEQSDSINFLDKMKKAETEPGKLVGTSQHAIEPGKMFAINGLCVVRLDNVGLLTAVALYGPVTESVQVDENVFRITVEKAVAINERWVFQSEEASNLQLGPLKKRLIDRLIELGCEEFNISEIPAPNAGQDSSPSLVDG